MLSAIATPPKQTHSRGRFPHMDDTIQAGRGDLAAIGRPRHRMQQPARLPLDLLLRDMPAIGKDNGSIGGVPDLRQLVRATGDDAPAPWRPAYRLDWPFVSG